ncbi:B9 domain-containing protein 2, partial [Globisporangium splendens]
MALRAARTLLSRRAPLTSAVGSRRAFMSTGANNIFSEPSFPVRSNGFEGDDPAVWLEKYARMDPSDMWKVGSFPLQDARDTKASSLLTCSEDLWDTSGMLSALSDNLPLRESGTHGVDELLREMDMTYGYFADSVLKKRRKKMNKHKHRKRKKALRMRTKKN